jgi:hypothetical protein
MDDQTISRQLALAIGWEPEQIIEYEGQEYIGLPVVFLQPAIKLFCYHWPTIIFPIAERYNAFPRLCRFDAGHFWAARVRGPQHVPMLEFSIHDTAAEAVALAVIAAHEKGLLK